MTQAFVFGDDNRPAHPRYLLTSAGCWHNAREKSTLFELFFVTHDKNELKDTNKNNG